MENLSVWPGKPYPLGASCDGTGSHFSLFSEAASRVELCLFDDHGNQTCVDLPEVTGFCWHGYLPGIEPGQRYGFRVHGPWAGTKWVEPRKATTMPAARTTTFPGMIGVLSMTVFSISPHA